MKKYSNIEKQYWINGADSIRELQSIVEDLRREISRLMAKFWRIGGLNSMNWDDLNRIRRLIFLLSLEIKTTEKINSKIDNLKFKIKVKNE